MSGCIEFLGIVFWLGALKAILGFFVYYSQRKCRWRVIRFESAFL